VKDSGPQKRRGAVLARSVSAALLAGILLVTGGFQAWVHSVQIRFDWDHVKGFKSISLEHRSFLPFYPTLLTAQARPWIADEMRKAGWRSAQGKRTVRAFLYVFVVGFDKEPFTDEIIDPETTPLMRAAEQGDKADVERLIAGGADVNTQDQRGWTALMHAAMKDREKEAELLLAAGASPNLKDRVGRTAMLWSARSCSPDVADVLAQRGASFNTKDNYGDTPSNYVSVCPGIARSLNVGGAR
jgi:Ankyrin repeats (3 copies)